MQFDFSKLMVVLCLLLFVGLLWWQEEAFLDQMSGSPRVIDGDSLEFNNERVRLKGIDAPEGRQMCQRNGKNWACGRASTNALKTLINNNSVECTGAEFDRHQRLLAICSVGGVEINRWMVKEGWAVSFGGGFYSEQQLAKSERRGVWQGDFEMPQDWRRRNNRR